MSKKKLSRREFISAALAGIVAGKTPKELKAAQQFLPLDNVSGGNIVGGMPFSQIAMERYAEEIRELVDRKKLG